jgi:hypothetical protein
MFIEMLPGNALIKSVIISTDAGTHVSMGNLHKYTSEGTRKYVPG